MSATLTSLTEEVLANLEGYSGSNEVVATLTSPLGTTGNATVSYSSAGDGTGFTPGVVEIGDELVYATSVDRSTGVLSGLIRGYRGSTVTSHNAGTLVRSKPRFPRHLVQRAINDTILGVYPALPVVRTHQFNYQGAVVRYPLPADARHVIQVSFLPSGASGEWLPSKRWNYDPTSANASGVSVEVWDAQPGQPVQVVYFAEATELASGGDGFASVSGLPEWSRDIIVYGACWRLMSFIDSANLGANTARQALTNADQQGRSETGTNLAKYYLAVYSQRLQEAERRIQLTYPAQRRFIQ